VIEQSQAADADGAAIRPGRSGVSGERESDDQAGQADDNAYRPTPHLNASGEIARSSSLSGMCGAFSSSGSIRQRLMISVAAFRSRDGVGECKVAAASRRPQPWH
jgi:hypothetical protein